MVPGIASPNVMNFYSLLNNEGLSMVFFHLEVHCITASRHDFSRV
jgi:hypothetical protein